MLTEREARQLFEDAMREERIEPDRVEVVLWDDGPTLNENMGFVVGKHINGEMKKRQTALSYTRNAEPHHLRQRIATAANSIANAFREDMMSTLRVCGTELRFCKAEGGWAECARCGTRVTLDECTTNLGFAEAAETSHPAPNPYDVQDFLQRLDDGHTEVLKLYLYGALHKQCHCDFGRPKDLSMGSPY